MAVTIKVALLFMYYLSDIFVMKLYPYSKH